MVFVTHSCLLQILVSYLAIKQCSSAFVFMWAWLSAGEHGDVYVNGQCCFERGSHERPHTVRIDTGIFVAAKLGEVFHWGCEITDSSELLFSRGRASLQVGHVSECCVVPAV